jgi:hypothetical protein
VAEVKGNAGKRAHERAGGHDAVIPSHSGADLTGQPQHSGRTQPENRNCSQLNSHQTGQVSSLPQIIVPQEPRTDPHD